MAEEKPIIVQFDLDETASNVENVVPKTETLINPAPTPGASTTLSTAVYIGSAAAIGKSAFNFVSTNYGNITNDAIGQMQINNALAVGGVAFSIGTGFAVGGLAGGIAAITASAISIANSAIRENINDAKSAEAYRENFEKLGIYSKNGGR